MFFPKIKQLSTKSVPLVEEDQFPAAPESGYGWSKLMGEIESKYLANEGITNSVTSLCTMFMEDFVTFLHLPVKLFHHYV